MSWAQFRPLIRPAFIAVAILAVPFMTWSILGWYATDLETNDKAMITVTAELALFAFLAWITYERLAGLAERQNWFTGALESHSTLQLVMRAHECGVPVIWWAPHYAEKPTTDRHGEINKLDAVYLSLPKNQRSSSSTKTMPYIF